MPTLFKNEYCTILYESSTDFIEVNWSGFPKSEQFREACNQLLVFMLQLSIKKLLTNNTQVKIFTVADQRWLNDEWLPKAQEIGYFCSATVNNNDIVVKTAISNITSRRSSQFISKQFTDVDEAKDWLTGINPK